MSDRLDELDYYTLFRVEDDASSDAIRRAYHTFALRYHPDRWTAEAEERRARAAEIFRRGAEGYRVLMDPEKRRAYDDGLARGRLRLSSDEERRSQRPRGSGANAVRSTRARPFAKQALRDAARGDYRAAKLQLTMALAHEPDNPELLAQLAEVERHLGGASR